MKVWIDLANSPHPLIFAPICRQLEQEGATVAVTVRDHAQTLELCRERWPDAAVIGGPSPKGRLAKSGAVAARVRDLARWGRGQRPDVALSHNSYAQVLAARSMRLPVVTAMDYEYQPANHLAFRAAHRILLPEAFPADLARRQGARPRKLTTYAGFKEELYLADFTPDRSVRERSGLPPTGALAVVRAAPTGATYHPAENPLFLEALEVLGSQPGLTTVVLARHPEQRTAIGELGLANLHQPSSVVDARSLLFSADLFLGAGGTMTREAALLGVPTFSIFAGRVPAVDEVLAEQGRITRLESVAQLPEVRPRGEHVVAAEASQHRGRQIGEAFVEATITAARGA